MLIFNYMKSFINKFLLLITFFMLTALSSFALEPVKINGLIFDNSDNLIFLDTKGTIDNSVTFSKGTLKEPDRIYLDINNAILTTPKKTYTAKYSGFNNIKVSQFTLEPKTVRIVFEYNKKLDVNSFKVLKTKDSIFIKTNKTLVDNSSLKTVYSNSKTANRKTFFEGATFNEVLASTLTPNEILISSNPENEILKELQITKKENEPKTNSKFYIDSITKTNKGILINGLGKLSIIPPFELTEPNRLVIDLDDSVINPELRNKTYKITETETIKFGQNSQSIARIVIQGENAKSYRGIISPDSKSLYLTDRKNIIETKMADVNSNLINTSFSESNGIKTATINFSDSVAFNVFEENSNLYIDINNRSPSWASVNFLRRFLLDKKLTGPIANIKSLNRLQIGDIIQLRQNVLGFNHSLIISKIENNEIYVCAHSIDALDRPLSSYKYEEAVGLHIIGIHI